MKAEEKRFLRFLEWADKSFVIPVYQRNYDWKKEQCKQLFDDLIQITKDDFRTHFLWTIVAYSDDGYGQELLVIDGQQRLTTLSLLLLAIYKTLDTWSLQSVAANKEKIYNEFLINKYSTDKTKKIRLKPVKDDREAFNSIFEWERKENSNIVVNYDYFFERIQKQEVSIDDLYKAIEHLIIVEILLKKWEDDPQLIFESLNSTWLDLSEADKVRNFILMKENTDTQERFYKDYWYKIEVNTRFDVSRFLRDYLTFKERRIPNISKVYQTFKEYIQKDFPNIEDLLKDLLRFSSYFQIILTSSDEDREVSKVLKRINKLETEVAFPFLLELYSNLEKWIISKKDILTILLSIESFVFRRFICDIPTNALNKVFMQLGKEIESFPEYVDDYVSIFHFVLLQKTSSQIFPNDQDFSEALLKKDIYQTQSRNKLHLLERLESFDNRESDIERLLDEWELTIEHIMPQTLTPEWEEALWNNAKDIQSKYIHTLGNITLTWYNSKYSNKSFLEKKTMEKWFNESPLFLNGYLKTVNEWNEKTILARYDVLKNKALETWKFPITAFAFKKDQSKMFTMWDDHVFTGEIILEYSFEGKDYKVESWRNFYGDMVKILFDRDPILLRSLVQHESFTNRLMEKEDPAAKFRTSKIADELYLVIGLGTETMVSTLKIMLEKFEIPPEDVTIYIK